MLRVKYKIQLLLKEMELKKIQTDKLVSVAKHNYKKAAKLKELERNTQKEYNFLVESSKWKNKKAEDESKMNQIFAIVSEMQIYLEDLNDQLLKNTALRDLYYGFYIFDGKIILNPTFLFVGENPNPFSWNHTYPPTVNVEPNCIDHSSFTAYINREMNHYVKANEIIDVFKMCSYKESDIRKIFDKQSTRIYLYSLINQQQDEIKNFFNHYDKYFFEEFNYKSRLWAKKLIDVIQPKIIICEGKTVFDELNIKFKYENTHWEDDLGYAFSSESSNNVLLGFGNEYGHILNKEGFANLLKKFITKENIKF